MSSAKSQEGLRSRRGKEEGDSPAAPQAKTESVDLPRNVIVKLIGFSLLMILAPVGTYFYSLEHLFNGKANYAAIAAVIVTNLIVFAYVVVAYLEDTPESSSSSKKET